VWFSTTDVRARGKTSTALRQWAEVVRRNSTNGGGGPVWCFICKGERGEEGVEKERQFVNWFPGLSARPENSNVKLQMFEMRETLN
jgi:hypothetical protein